MNALAEATVSSFRPHPDVTWTHLTPDEVKAIFAVECDPVQVHFQGADGNAWNVAFEVESSKLPTQVVAIAFRILSGVFQAIREFLAKQRPERLAFVPDTDTLRHLAEAYLSGPGRTLAQIGYRFEQGVFCLHQER